MKRHELSDQEWAAVEPLIPNEPAKTGRKRRPVQEMLNGILWILRTGAPWRDLPERFGPWQTVYDYYSRWRRDGVFDRILAKLQIRLDAEGHVDWDLWCVDGSNVRAARAAGGADKKVAAATRTSQPTTHWAAAAADSGRNSTWLLTARPCRWPSKSLRGRCTNRRGLRA